MWSKEVYNLGECAGIKDITGASADALTQKKTKIADWVNNNLGDILYCDTYNTSNTIFHGINFYIKGNSHKLFYTAWQQGSSYASALGLYYNDSSNTSISATSCKWEVNLTLLLIRSDYGFLFTIGTPDKINTQKQCILAVKNSNGGYTVYSIRDGVYNLLNSTGWNTGSYNVCGTTTLDKVVIGQYCHNDENVYTEGLYVSSGAWIGSYTPFQLTNGSKFVEAVGTHLALLLEKGGD